ncbi:MAG: hypothetical protein PHV36_08900 [Elusimicrobiales bacterium]|nr:hypothetical protein [Elusimicrobiales bacterium]
MKIILMATVVIGMASGTYATGSSGLAVKAAEVSFDNGARSGLSVAELKTQSAGDNRVPVPSTYTPTTEMTNFWGNLTENTKDKICKAANIKINQSAHIISQVGIDGGLRREFKSYPDQRLALVDEVSLKLNTAIGTQLLTVPNVGSVGVSISGALEGRSVVVRPLADNRYCKNLGMLVKLYDVKTVLPISAKSINSMENGEVWKLPMVARYSFSIGAGASISEAVNVSIGAGETGERRPTVSLYKIDENNLRVRFRVDHVTVKSVGVSAGTVNIPAGDIGVLNGENLIAKEVNKALASEINKYIAFKLGYSYARVSGQKLLLEFYVNPNNPEQVEKLAEFLKGNLDTIQNFIKMGLRFDQFSEEASSQSGVGEIEDLAEQAGTAIGANSTFAGADHYNSSGHNFNITLPVIQARQDSWSSSYHRYQSLDNNGAIHVQQQTRVSNKDSVNIPLVGTLVKHNSRKDIYVVNQEGVNGEVSKPVLLYQKYEGFVRHNDSSARGILDGANDVLKYAGRRGNGTDSSNTLPSASIFPPLPPAEQEGYDDNPQNPAKTYRSAAMSFRLVFSEQAVQDIIFAPTQMIMKCFMNVMRETESAILDKVMDLFAIDNKGEVSYDRNAMAKRLNDSGFSTANTSDGGTNPLDIVSNLAHAATKFIEKLASVREEATWKGQSERLAEVAAHGDMKYDDFLKVVIQLVDTRNISAEIFVHTDKRVEGEEDVTQNYTMFNSRENGFDNTIAPVTQMQQRFSDPAELTD